MKRKEEEGGGLQCACASPPSTRPRRQTTPTIPAELLSSMTSFIAQGFVLFEQGSPCKISHRQLPFFIHLFRREHRPPTSAVYPTQFTPPTRSFILGARADSRRLLPSRRRRQILRSEQHISDDFLYHSSPPCSSLEIQRSPHLGFAIN